MRVAKDAKTLLYELFFFFRTMCVQFMTGVVMQTLMAGVIFAKLARPIKRAATILFSKNAVICMRDGKLCLLFRVGDMRKSSLAEAHVRLQVSTRADSLCVNWLKDFHLLLLLAF